MIELKNVFIQYVNEFYSLYNFSCEVKTHTLFVGDFFNGTTAIMRILSKIDKHYKGEVFVDNLNLTDIKDKDLNLVYLPQCPILFKNKNIFKNLFYPLKIRKINKNIAKNLIYSIFFELENNNLKFLEDYLNNKNNNILNVKIKKLSLSEQKIIALIRAIVRKPKYVLLENFFEDLDNSHFKIAEFLLNKLKEVSTIIACEKDITKTSNFNNFKLIDLSKPEKEKKEV